MNHSKGSEWRKWDLHIHTPFTKLSNGYPSDGDVWDAFCDQIENSDVAVFGITDYFSVANYFSFIERHKAKYPESNKVFFPNIEFRLEVSVNREAEEVNIHIIFNNAVNKEKIEEFLSKLPTNITRNGATVCCGNLNNSEIVSAGVEYRSIKLKLKEVFGKEEPYLILAAANNAGLRPDNNSPRKLNISDEIDKICDGFFGGKQNVRYYLNPNRYETNEIARSKPVVSGCDAHSFDDIENWLGKHVTREGYEIYKSITWIKADTTFEGLKQIFYEPEDRVRIQKTKPQSLVRKISEIQLDFDKKTKIKLNSGQSDTFCFANSSSRKILLSDYFTCFVGGRGTGKSTLLNVLYKGAEPSAKTDFIENSRISLNDEEIDINDYVQIENTAESIEFLEQNQIENFATNEVEFTQAIYSRLKNREDDIDSIESDLETSLLKIDDQITLIKKKIKLSEEIEELQKKYEAEKKITDTVQTDDYKRITDDISKNNQLLISLKNDREKLESIRNAIDELRTTFPSLEIDEESSKYLKSYNDFLNKLGVLSEEVLGDSNFGDEKALEEELQNRIDDQKDKLHEYLESQGLSEANLDDVKEASVKADEYANSKLEKEKEAVKLETKIETFDLSAIEEIKQKFDNKVKETIDELKEVLDEVNRSNPDEIDKIDLQFEFNIEKAKDNVFDDFFDYFQKYREQENPNWKNHAKNCLFEISPREIINQQKHLEDIKKSIKGDNKYNAFLEDVFNDDVNFDLYILLIQKHLYDSSKYLLIDVFYRDKPIEFASFGQKCTAVMVIMLLFGHNPIIIDEPEAHLDSSLIANYLVNLIKKQKEKRQIIFATHNANFVINADAEQIYILDMPEKQTNFTQTTIENLERREKLLKLEGGEDAFSKRENKYGFRKT